VRIRRGDAFAVQRLGAAILEAVRHGDAQLAASEVEQLHRFEQRCDRARREGKALLLYDVQAHQPQVADVLLHQVRDVVVAHEQHVQRHVLAVAHQLVLAAAVFEAAARQQVERAVGEPAAFLYGDLQAYRVRGVRFVTH
jgi:hypothetical protein